MGILDFFKRTGKPITAEAVEAKARDVATEIATKELTIGKLRADLPGQVLDGDNLAAHRIEHEEREIRALQVTKTELEAKARELRIFEAFSEEISRFEAAAENGRECATLAKALIAAIIPVADAARAVLAANAKFVSSIPMPRVNLGKAAEQLLSDLDRLVVFALEDPGALEGAIASTIGLCVVNAESVRERRGNNEEPAPKQAKVG
ncbi:hypothetical protein [Candidatus Binatus sp.]|uniref:hypothetical protein n=1 Tax=Candidatus Binatus sp. TaxID=2811406 RepID=UPI003CC5526E